MTGAFYQLPTVLILAALVGIFIALGRHHDSARFKMWRAAWILIFLRFVLQLAYGRVTFDARILAAVDLAIMQLSAVFFLVSVCPFPHIPYLRRAAMLTIGLPLVLYAPLMVYSAGWGWVYALLIGIGFGSSIYYVWSWYRQWSAYITIQICAMTVVGLWAMYKSATGRPDIGFYATLTYIFASTGVYFLRRYQRISPGIVTTSVGFFLWALVSPAVYFADALLPAGQLRNELWNVPKFLVAFGMIVTLLEDESVALRASRERESRLNLQLQRFAEITSRLLSGKDVRALCSYIAQVLAESTNFQRVVILLADDKGIGQVAGLAGTDQAAVDALQQRIGGGVRVEELCQSENRLAACSYRCTVPELAQDEPRRRAWFPADHVIVALRSSKGRVVGGLVLGNPRDPRLVTGDDLSTVELLAADLAVAIENSALQQQLVRSEKLAGIGRVVAGVAHELNNPLTAIIGYAELLADNENAPKRELEIIRREGMRMKHIIENMVRFGRPSTYERRSASLSRALDEVLKLRGFDIRSQQVEVVQQLPASLPPVAMDETLLKQVLIHLLNNAIDAVNGRPERRITIEGEQRDERVEVRVKDSGNGFADLSHVFDPFYTTKDVGKGTGLGLSICYGVVRDHGGEISADNLQPHGACVTMLLPVAGAAQPLQPLPPTAGASAGSD